MVFYFEGVLVLCAGRLQGKEYLTLGKRKVTTLYFTLHLAKQLAPRAPLPLVGGKYLNTESGLGSKKPY